MRQKDYGAGILLSVVGIAFSAASFRLPWRESGYGWFGSPGLVPLILAVLLVCIGVRLMYRSRKDDAFYRKMDERTEPCFCEEDDEVPVFAEAARPAWMEKEYLRALLTGVLCAGYVLSLGKVPYMLATALFISVFILVFRGGSFFYSVVIGATTSVSVWFVFFKIFAVFLP